MAYDTEGHELQRLFANWGKLSERAKSIILIAAEVRPPSGPGQFRKIRRVRKGESPGWLPTALNILKDAQGYITDRQMAVMVGVSASTISRNATYQNAVKTYGEPLRKVVRRGPKRKLRNI
jgi:hypothetical protein